MSVDSFLSATRRFFGSEEEVVEMSSPPEPRVPVEQKFRADSRLHRARRYKPGIYRLYLEGGGKILFKLWSVPYHEDGSLIVRIFPISFYSSDGELVKKISREDGVAPVFFSRSILKGKWDPSRVPYSHREALEFWAPLFCEGVAHYEERQSQNRHPFDL